MCEKRRTLRVLVNERLTAAAEEIFALVERTIAEYEEELCRSKEENQRNQQLLDSVLKTQLLHTTADAEIQTERSKDLKEEAEKSPEFSCVIVKHEGGEEEEPAQMEPDEWSAAAVQTAKGCSDVDAADGDAPEKTDKSPIAKRRGRPSVRRAKAADPGGAPEFPPLCQSHGNAEGNDKNGSGSEIQTRSSSQETREIPQKDPTAAAQSKCSKPKRTWSTRRRRAVGKSSQSKSVKEFRCSVCERTFRRLHHLERHVLIHTGERSFSCSVCHKCFRLKQHLMSHMSIHTDEKLFGCSLCPLKFKRKDNLGQHLKSHSGVRPFGCSECDVRFSLKKNLLRHMIVHSRDVTFSCSLCHMTFSSPFYFQKHQKSHKKKKKVTH